MKLKRIFSYVGCLIWSTSKSQIIPIDKRATETETFAIDLSLIHTGSSAALRSASQTENAAKTEVQLQRSSPRVNSRARTLEMHALSRDKALAGVNQATTNGDWSALSALHQREAATPSRGKTSIANRGATS